MSKCIDHPRMVFKGTLTYEGHSVTFDIKDDYVEVTNRKEAMISVKKVDTDKAILRLTTEGWTLADDQAVNLTKAQCDEVLQNYVQMEGVKPSELKAIKDN